MSCSAQRAQNLCPLKQVWIDRGDRKRPITIHAAKERRQAIFFWINVLPVDKAATLISVISLA